MEGEAHSVTIGNVPRLERFQAIPNGKSRFLQVVSSFIFDLSKIQTLVQSVPPTYSLSQ